MTRRCQRSRGRFVHRDMRSTLLALVAIALLAMPATALSSHEGIPPGAGDEYVEGVPAPGGEKPSTGQGGGGGGSGPVLSPDAQDALAAEGALGQQVGAVAAATAPDSQAGNGNTARSADSRDDESGSGFEEVVTAITGSSSDGMGFVLPAILGASLVAAVMLLVARRRRGTAETR